MSAEFLRELTKREKEFLSDILPLERKAYHDYYNSIHDMVVLGQGRRGQGEIILGFKGDVPDIDQPLPAVFAYGMIETNFGPISITVRDIILNQVSLEIVSHRMEIVPEDFEEFRRWTYSKWTSGFPCPQCLKPVREISMHSDDGQHFVLAVCQTDKRIWVFDPQNELVRLIPVTNYYNELMLHKNIRDPKVALNAQLLFKDLATYNDAELSYAFFTYNKLRTKVHIRGNVQADTQPKQGLISSLKQLFSGK